MLHQKTNSQTRTETISARRKTRNGRPKRRQPGEPAQRPGRPEVFDADAASRLLTAIRAGNYLYVARDFAGIGQSTFHRWMVLARKGIQPYAEFSTSLDQALAQAEVSFVALVNNAARRGHWRAAAWMLERRFPSRWGRKAFVGAWKINPDELTDEELDAILAGMEPRGISVPP